MHPRAIPFATKVGFSESARFSEIRFASIASSVAHATGRDVAMPSGQTARNGPMHSHDRFFSFLWRARDRTPWARAPSRLGKRMCCGLPCERRRWLRQRRLRVPGPRAAHARPPWNFNNARGVAGSLAGPRLQLPRALRPQNRKEAARPIRRPADTQSAGVSANVVHSCKLLSFS